MPTQTDQSHRGSGEYRRAATRGALVFAVAALAVGSGLTAEASAAAPTVEVRLDMSQPIAAGELCPFEVTFTGKGDVRITTFQDGRQSIHGSLAHTIYSQWVTLYSPGPAPVHVDLTTGAQITTGMHYAFHLPQVGMVFASAGRLDGIQWRGLEKVNVDELCAALARPQ